MQDAPQGPRDKATGNLDSTSQTDSGQAPPGKLYAARISLDKSTMDIDGQEIPLTPGMAVTAEIKTGKQRMIDYLLSPIRRYKHDSFRER